jgi:Ca2+-binding EF-hand superfamily protein
MAEAQNGRGSLKDSFTQYDTNRDGFIDANEYTVYISARFGGGGMGGTPGMGGSPWGSQSPQGGFPGGPPGGWGGGSSSSDRSRDRKKDEESEKVFVYRYGSLPKELPSWFSEMDFDKDGQIAVYEWKNSGKKLDDFTELDLNNDGFVTADEWIRKQSLDLAKREVEERMANPNGSSSPANLRGGSRAPGGWSGGGGSSSFGSSSTSGSSGRGNPFTSGGPPSRGGGGGEDRRSFSGRENARDNKDTKEEKKDRKSRE